MNPITRAAAGLTGRALEIIGKRLDKTHLQWLGHYMAGSGKPLAFPAKYEPWLRHQCKSKQWHLHQQPADGLDVIVVPESGCPADSELYHTLGKFTAHVDGNRSITATDDYRFYPWCGKYNHFAGCDCKDVQKSWGSVTVLDLQCGPWNGFFRICENGDVLQINLSGGIQFSLPLKIPGFTLCADTGNISLSISDQWFANAGVPFVTTGTVSL